MERKMRLFLEIIFYKNIFYLLVEIMSITITLTFIKKVPKNIINRKDLLKFISDNKVEKVSPFGKKCFYKK